MLVVMVLFAVSVSHTDRVPFSRVVSPALIFWAVVFLPLFLFQLVPRYRIRDDRLTERWQGVGCNLPEVVLTDLYRWRPVGGKFSYLMLVVNANIKIKLGDELWSRCYYRPENLRALADSLAKSPHPQPQAAAAWLRQYADDPRSQPWPPLRKRRWL